MTHMAVFRRPLFQGFDPFEEGVLDRIANAECSSLWKRELLGKRQFSMELEVFFVGRENSQIFSQKSLRNIYGIYFKSTYYKFIKYYDVIVQKLLFYLIFLDQRRRCVSAQWVTGYCPRAFTGRANKTVGENSRSVKVRGNEYEYMSRINCVEE